MSHSSIERLPDTFNRLAWSNLAAQSAEQIALAAAPIVAVLLLGVGEGQTGLLQTALTLPFVLFAIPAGLLADRISRRALMASAEALRAAALLMILALIWFGVLTLPLLALLGFAAVCGTVVYSVAAPSLVPSLVPSRLLSAANARIELARTVAQLRCPPDRHRPRGAGRRALQCGSLSVSRGSRLRVAGNRHPDVARGGAGAAAGDGRRTRTSLTGLAAK
jgi:hypothetical protein